MQALAQQVLNALFVRLGHEPDREDIFDFYWELISEFKRRNEK